MNKSTTLREAKTLIQAKQNSKWMQEHPQHNKKDPYHLLSRQEQVIIFRLRTGHNRMKKHIFDKLLSLTIKLLLKIHIQHFMMIQIYG